MNLRSEIAYFKVAIWLSASSFYREFLARFFFIWIYFPLKTSLSFLLSRGEYLYPRQSS